MQEQDGDEDAYDESTVPGAAEAAPRPAEPSPADPPAEPPSNESLAAESAAPAAGAGTISSGLAVNLVELCVCVIMSPFLGRWCVGALGSGNQSTETVQFSSQPSSTIKFSACSLIIVL